MSTTLLNFLPMFVTYKDNFIIPFSDNLCDKSGKLCHCIIPVSDNVRDISGQLPCQIFWICVWHIRKSVSLYHPIFRRCLWHIRPTLSKVATEKKKGGREKRKKGGNSDNYDVASRPSNGNRLQSCYLCLISHSGCDISQDLYHFIIPFSDNTHDISNKPTGIVDCVQIIFSYFPLQLNIMFSFSNQSLEVSIETIKK